MTLGDDAAPKTPESHGWPKLLGPTSASIKIVTGDETRFSYVCAARTKAALAGAFASRFAVARRRIVRCPGRAVAWTPPNFEPFVSRWFMGCKPVGLILSSSRRSDRVATRHTVSPFASW